MIKLRDYQQDAISALQDIIRAGKKRPIMTLPTGAGKGRIIAAIAHSSLSKNRKVLITAHRAEILDQLIDNLNDLGADFTNLELITVQTMVRSPHKIPSFDLCIIDEAHIGNFRKFMELSDPKREKYFIGVTATPMAASKKKPLWQTFDDVSQTISINDLIGLGYLSKPTYHIAKVDTSSLVKDSTGDFSNSSQNDLFNQTTLLHSIDDAWLRRVGKTVIFTPNNEMTEQVAQRFNIPFVHSNISKQERDDRIDHFKNDGQAIVNTGILTTGFDAPMIETVIIYRATTSLPLFLQMCGRGSRVVNGQKHKFHIVDLGGNVERLGQWHQEHNWQQIMMTQGRKITDGVAPVKECPKCGYLNHTTAKVCKAFDCTYIFPDPKKEKLKATTWQTFKYGDQMPTELRKPVNEMTADELLARAALGSKQHGKSYSISWVVYQVGQMPADRWLPMLHKIAKIKGYKKGWVMWSLGKIRSQNKLN